VKTLPNDDELGIDKDLEQIRDRTAKALPSSVAPVRTTRQARRERWMLGGLVAALLTAACSLGIAVTANGHADDSNDVARSARSGQAALASQVAGLGATPVTTPPGVKVTPSPGPPGQRGVGIAGTKRVGTHLFLIGTDNSLWDAGEVVGPQGKTGPSGGTGASGSPGRDGTNGRGITTSGIIDGHLILNYDDGTSQDVGQVVGPKGDAGVGVKDVSISDTGHLIVTLSDNTSHDAGPLPTGPVCPSGYNVKSETVLTDDGPLLTSLCVADNQPSAGVPSGDTPS
jgi:hypothetical protein